MMFFFFQAEDGIRDYKVTGVQTCALPISHAVRLRAIPAGCGKAQRGSEQLRIAVGDRIRSHREKRSEPEIGRASCRERVESPGVRVEAEGGKRCEEVLPGGWCEAGL